MLIARHETIRLNKNGSQVSESTLTTRSLSLHETLVPVHSLLPVGVLKYKSLSSERN